MNEIEASDGLGVMGTLEQMIKVLGFHDWASFLISSAFVLVAVAFFVSMTIFFVKKRRERRSELLRVVHDVQKELEGEPEPKAKPFEGFKEPKAKTIEQEIAQPLPPKPVIKAPPVARPVEVKKTVVEKPVELKPEVKKTPDVSLVTPAQKSIEELKPEPIKPVVEPQKSLGAALSNTRSGFIAKLSRLFGGKASISDADFEEMEAILFTADIGVKTAQKLLDGIKERVKTAAIVDKSFLHQALKEEMQKIFSTSPKKALLEQSPQVIMFVGVNGAGKTTSVGKLGAQLAQKGKKVIFAAGDTFRAAAVEQLSLWGQRSNIEVVCGKENADSASVLFEGIERGKAIGADYILCDTAGRLHTKLSLMEELAKVHRVLGKALPGAPHEVFLVVDATMGQNAIAQAREFAAATPLTGVVLSKLDGTAKGGVALGIVDDLKVPIRYVGIGEKAFDLKDFDAEEFINALVEEA